MSGLGHVGDPHARGEVRTVVITPTAGPRLDPARCRVSGEGRQRRTSYRSRGALSLSEGQLVSALAMFPGTSSSQLAWTFLFRFK